MDIPEVRFRKPVKKWWRRRYSPLLIILGLMLGLFLFTSPTSPANLTTIFNPNAGIEFDNGRINILLLGNPGPGHDGPNLTDTIMVASLDPEKKVVDLISLPRDLWVEDHKVKVNTLYHLGLKNEGGVDFVASEIGQMLGMKIPYSIRVDFNGFIQAVDLIEGIDVNVQRSFDDYAYPIPGKEKDLCELTEKEVELNEEAAKTHGVSPGKIKALVDKEEKIATVAASPGGEFVFTDNSVIKLFPCRFEHLQFKAGPTHMDGETALKFVRSRHGTGSEGNDFARSKRQQLVLLAFRDKVLSLETLTDPQKIAGLIQAFDDNVDINIPTKVVLKLVDMTKKVETVHNFTIEAGGKDPLLIVPPAGDYGGSFVLIPPKNDFLKIQTFIKAITSGQYEATATASKADTE